MKLAINKASTLHTFNASPLEHRVLFDRFIRFASPGDSLLLIENGVYALTNDYCLSTLRAMGFSLFCLQDDVRSRGLHTLPVFNQPDDRLPTNGLPDEYKIILVNDDGFVKLACAHHKVVSWFT